ncbi:metalloregulator ArsR/SmtB family transcription factor [Myxococcota bacterium]|nr:metalloregulator ArsR/SmtB family transcription factor [Myxococcota bacterium]
MKPQELDTIIQNLDKNNDILETQVEFLKTLANRHRFKIVMALGQIQGEMEQRDLQKIVGISKANLSQHLALLRSSGVINSRPYGRITYLSLKYPAIKDACSLVREMITQRAFDLMHPDKIPPK